MMLLLGGTADAREIARTLTGAGHRVLLTAVSDYAGDLATEDATAVRTGALTRVELTALVAEATAVIDATHPFAAAISQMTIEVCQEQGKPYLRYERPASEHAGHIITVPTASEAAHKAVELANGGTIYLTVGSKSLGVYLPVIREANSSVIARVLPTAKVLAECECLGLTPREILAMQGPVTTEVEIALLRHHQARVLVTKDSGAAGGVEEKLAAADMVGIPAIIVGRPAIDYPVMVSTITEVAAWAAKQEAIHA